MKLGILQMMQYDRLVVFRLLLTENCAGQFERATCYWGVLAHGPKHPGYQVPKTIQIII